MVGLICYFDYLNFLVLIRTCKKGRFGNDVSIISSMIKSLKDEEEETKDSRNWNCLLFLVGDLLDL